MRARAMIMASLAFLLATVNASGAMVAGIQPKTWQANAERHVMTMKRHASNVVETNMIAAAEIAAPKGTNTWFSGEKSNIKIPFAITREALAYYEALIQGYQRKSWTTYMEPLSKMTYEAKLAHHDSYALSGKTYKDVYVVTLKLDFSASFTEKDTEGIEFSKERTVVLDSKGSILFILGDGVTEAPMFAI